jgi:hypothetical protein
MIKNLEEICGDKDFNKKIIRNNIKDESLKFYSFYTKVISKYIYVEENENVNKKVEL